MRRGFHAALLLLAAAGILLAFSAAAYALPTLERTIIIPRWRVIGPFLSGVREAGTDPLAFYAGETGPDNPLLRGSFPSVLVPGGEARWQYYESDENGAINVTFPNVPEESMTLVTDEWGFAGAMTMGYAFGAIDVPEEPCRALVDLQDAGGFTLNGVPYPGDAYGHHMLKTPVILQQGRNEFKVGFGRSSGFTMKIEPVTADLIALTDSATVPDLVRGVQPDSPMLFAVPLVNTTDHWIELTGARVELGSLFGGCGYMNARIPPLGIYNWLFTPCPVEPVSRDLGEEVSVAVTAKYDGGEIEFDLKLRVRDPGQSRRVTFASQIDSSTQYYGLLPPKDYDPDKEYGLILTLHGAGVEAAGQVDAYQPKDWAFVVAPTNRRRFGFDWQDWGRLDMLEVLNDVKSRYHIDENRIHLTGHSMGGHGTWYNALTYPGLWATAAPSAGWTTFDLYVPMFLRQNVILGAPGANYIWNLAMREDNTLVLAENALNLPIYALEGGADDNVPPQQPRMLFEQLARRGYDINYEEVPGMGHWWSKPDTPFTDCVDNEYHNEFWRSHVRNPWPKKVVFRTHNYSISDGAYWVKVLAPVQVYDDLVVRAEVVSPMTVKVTTANVQALQLDLAPELLAPGDITVQIDRDVLTVDTTEDSTVVLATKYLHWERREAYEPQLPAKTPETYGPWKQALMKPFVLVYGTTGTPEQTEWNLQLARLYAYQWWYRANGRTSVYADTAVDFTSPLWQRINLVLLGGPDCNAVTARLQDKLPIRSSSSAVTIRGTGPVFGQDLTYKFIYPNPETGWKTLVLVEGGTSLEAMKRLPAVMGVYSGSGFPDWMVWGDDFKLQGLGGVSAMGFFDYHWRVDDRLTFWNEDVMSR
jgi:dienelactone hydrolase